MKLFKCLRIVYKEINIKSGDVTEKAEKAERENELHKQIREMDRDMKKVKKALILERKRAIMHIHIPP